MILIPTNPLFPRFIIHHCGRYWTGSVWAMDKKKALFYPDVQSAAGEAAHIERNFLNITTILHVPMHFVVESPWGIDLDQMQRAFAKQFEVGIRQYPHLPSYARINTFYAMWEQMKVSSEDDPQKG